MRRVEKMIEIEAPLERVFDLFSDFESFPHWMRHVKDVRRTGRRYTRWWADTPFGMDIEWETETVIFEPDHRIAWRSVRGDVDTDGEVVFTEIDPHTTRLRMVLGYAPPAGRIGDAFARLFGRNPTAELGADLRHFKQIAERRAGNGRSQGRAERARRRAAEDEQRMGERARARRSTPRFADARRPRERAERRSDERYYRDVLGLHGRDESARMEHGREARKRGAGFQEDRKLERERRFNGALREERHDHPRYALTPRERERERAERDWDREAKHQLLRRNVDRLLNEGPSRNWRRWE